MKNTINISYEEYMSYQNFMQYGNLSGAKVIFVGREEGLGGQDIKANYEGRKKWFNEIPENIQYLEDNDSMKGYYIDDAIRADWIRCKPEKEFEDFVKEDQVKSHALTFPAKLMVLLNNGFNIEENKMKTMVADYKTNKLYRKDNETAMFDYYTLPKQGENKFICSEIDENKATEYRKELIKKVYNTYKLPISIVYAGIEKNEFRLKNFYEELGFVFEQKDTSMVNDKFSDIVKPSSKPKSFLLGKRKDINQYCLMTPFFGNGQISDEDIKVISTWVKAINL